MAAQSFWSRAHFSVGREFLNLSAKFGTAIMDGRRNDVVYGYQPWQRGQRLGYYQGRYSEVDYRTDRRLDRPPRGYHWVRNDSGDFLLAAIATGIIAQVILSSTR